MDNKVIFNYKNILILLLTVIILSSCTIHKPQQGDIKITPLIKFLDNSIEETKDIETMVEDCYYGINIKVIF